MGKNPITICNLPFYFSYSIKNKKKKKQIVDQEKKEVGRVFKILIPQQYQKKQLF